MCRPALVEVVRAADVHDLVAVAGVGEAVDATGAGSLLVRVAVVVTGEVVVGVEENGRLEKVGERAACGREARGEGGVFLGEERSRGAVGGDFLADVDCSDDDGFADVGVGRADLVDEGVEGVAGS